MKKCLLLYGENNIINLFNPHPSKINLHAWWIELKKQLKKNGIDLVSKNTLKNKLHDLEIHLNAYHIKENIIPKFAILTECKYIHPENSNLNLLKKYSHVFSWDPSLVNIGLATKINFAHPLGKGIVDGYSKRKKLVVLFGSNRSLKGWYPKYDLYKERVKTIKWFENNAIRDFSLYGKKWNLSARFPTKLGGIIHSIEKKIPFKSTPFPSWNGEIENKQNILLKSRFSIVYENIQGLKGYITEKIFDAFVAGNVPVYWGASDINNYIPKNTFIDRRNFLDHKKLYEYIKNMPEQEFIDYQRNISDFLKNKSSNFSCEKFSHTIVSKINEFIGK